MNRDKQISEDEQFSELVMLITEGARSAVEDADAVLNAGYRKASYVACEIFEEIERLLELNVCHGDVFTGRYFSEEIEADIAELKKKYIGEDTNGTDGISS